MHHKRKGPKTTRGGCLMCKRHKHQGNPKSTRFKGLRVPRKVSDLEKKGED